MDSFILLLLLLALISPFILGIAGIVCLANSDVRVKKKGKILLLLGIILFLVEILIGYSLCSNMHLGGLH